jgi:hypothetical protein
MKQVRCVTEQSGDLVWGGQGTPATQRLRMQRQAVEPILFLVEQDVAPDEPQRPLLALSKDSEPELPGALVLRQLSPRVEPLGGAREVAQQKTRSP